MIELPRWAYITGLGLLLALFVIDLAIGNYLSAGLLVIGFLLGRWARND